LLIIALLEVIIYAVDFEVVAKIGTLDVGGSMVIHAFGAYFGLAASYVLTPKKAFDHPKNASSYNSDMFAMIGTVFLWIYWPSFVSGLVPEAREVCALHTVLALCGSCVSAFAASYLFDGRFDMVHIQNATLAGGVAIGTCADMKITLCGSIAIGMASGLLSTAGYAKVTPCLERIGVHDTCGIHNLHGMPGVLGGLTSILVVAVRGAEHLHDGVDPGAQAGKQILGLVVMVAFAVVGGGITGAIAKVLCPPLLELFEDTEFWTVEEGEGRLKPSAEADESPSEPGKPAPEPPLLAASASPREMEDPPATYGASLIN
jgi:ammonium transporter Rh